MQRDEWYDKIADSIPVSPALLNGHGAQPKKPESAPARLLTKKLADVKPQPLRWLWPGRIPRGKLTIIYGDPGLGKSFATLDIASRVSTGCGWPDRPHEGGERGRVILLSAEDDLHDTIRPRLDAAGADCDYIEAIEAVGDPGGERHYFDLTRDLRHLDELIKERGDVALCIIDPVSAYAGRTDSHNNAETRSMLAPVADLAARHGVAVVAVSHRPKSAGRALHSVCGSIAFIAAARAGWLVIADPDSATRRLMLPAKMNLAEAPKGMAFTLRPVGNTAQIAWTDDDIDMTADEALAREATAHADDDDGSAIEDATAWLTAALADGPAEAKDIERDRKQNSITMATLRRAKKALGVRSIKPDGVWHWALPQHAENQDAQAPIPDGEHLESDNEKTAFSVSKTAFQGAQNQGAQAEELGGEHLEYDDDLPV